MKVINRALIKEKDFHCTFPEKERVIQFGEGNFLRGFVDWMIYKANTKGVFNGSVVVVQPIEAGLTDLINEQEGLYTLILRGLRDGKEVVERDVITSISRALKSHEQWQEVLKCAEKADIDIMISNTTEAGIQYSKEDKLNDTPPRSFPGKVCAYLYQRFKAFSGDLNKGMVIIPCELIDRNGDKLKEVVIRLAKEWHLEEEFIDWIEKANYFLNSLVDRIVTGYPGREQAEVIEKELGYRDNLIDTGEIFHLWVIEGPADLKERFPLHKADLNVRWVEDMTPYRTRKVRILNGAHTSSFAVAYLAGIETVREAVTDHLIGEYMQRIIFNEIIPTLDMSEEELIIFAKQVIERFKNPYIQHHWLNISLNSVSKFKTRVLPSIKVHLEKGEIPELLSFAFASLLSFYHGEELTKDGLKANRSGKEYLISDDKKVLEYFYSLWKNSQDINKLVEEVLKKKDFWGEDLTIYQDFVSEVSKHLIEIENSGMKEALKKVLNKLG